jgi:hypothetical protein
VALLVEALSSKPEGRSFDSPWSGRTMALSSTQPLKEMSTRNISCGVKAAGAYS